MALVTSWLIFGCVVCASAQAVPAPSGSATTTAHHRKTKAAAALPGPLIAPAATPQTTTNVSTLPAASPPLPAEVSLRGGLLEVKAENADLQQILTTIAGLSGMVIDGSVIHSRVYGAFGPAEPRQVLDDLLVGLGYNYLMIGRTREGVPRELRLRLQNGKATPANPQVAGSKEPESEAPGPGAIIHVPPPPPEDPAERVRQNLERLQHMHDSVKQQTPQNPQ